MEAETVVKPKRNPNRPIQVLYESQPTLKCSTNPNLCLRHFSQLLFLRVNKPQVALIFLLLLLRCFIAKLCIFLILDLNYAVTFLRQCSLYSCFEISRLFLLLKVDRSPVFVHCFLDQQCLGLNQRQSYRIFRCSVSLVFGFRFVCLSCYCFGRCRTLKIALIFCTMCDYDYTKIYSRQCEISLLSCVAKLALWKDVS